MSLTCWSQITIQEPTVTLKQFLSISLSLVSRWKWCSCTLCCFGNLPVLQVFAGVTRSSLPQEAHTSRIMTNVRPRHTHSHSHHFSLQTRQPSLRWSHSAFNIRLAQGQRWFSVGPCQWWEYDHHFLVLPKLKIVVPKLKHKSLCDWNTHHVTSVLSAHSTGCPACHFLPCSALNNWYWKPHTPNRTNANKSVSVKIQSSYVGRWNSWRHFGTAYQLIPNRNIHQLCEYQICVYDLRDQDEKGIGPGAAVFPYFRSHSSIQLSSSSSSTFSVCSSVCALQMCVWDVCKKLIFLGILRYKFKLKIRSNLNLYRESEFSIRWISGV